MLHLAVDDDPLGLQLMAIARDPVLRQSVYERLGEYCHQCRNRLNSLKLSLYLARRGATGRDSGSWGTLDGHYLDLERMVERIQVICRPMSLSRVTIGLDLLVDDRRDDWTRLLSDRGTDLVCVAPAERAVASLDVDRMVSALDALATWRSEVSPPGSTTRLRWWVDSGTAHLSWEEEAPRSRFSSGTGQGPDRAWTLPLLARVVAEHEGELRRNDRDGWRLELSWPVLPR